MQITLVDRQNSLTPDTRELAERRLRFALSRFASKIEGISLVVADTNRPRGGVDKSCSVTVTLRRLSTVRVSSDDTEIQACIARAAERAGRAVARAIERSRHSVRRSSSL